MEKPIITIDLGEITNTCFVVMPFHSLFESEYNRVIRPAIEEVGLVCVRGDEIYKEQSIVQDIWRSIRSARVIVAELTNRNPNVMYEIGLAHALSKPIIFLTRNQEDVPFDLRSLRYLFYDPNDPFWGDNLRKELASMLRQTIETPSLQSHLNGINVMATLPKAPTEPLAQSTEEIDDISGIWQGKWLSAQGEIEHNATLVIPKHDKQITSSMTVSYLKESVPSIVQETLTGTMQKNKVLLTGINYTYIERGKSVSYSLDSFEVILSKDKKHLEGKVVSKNGEREIKFIKIPGK
jgi:hypothetical protein